MVLVAGSSKFVPTEEEVSESDWWEIPVLRLFALILDAGAYLQDTLTLESS
jgi:hypothetical protein